MIGLDNFNVEKRMTLLPTMLRLAGMAWISRGKILSLPFAGGE
jgi:hypothetical protein